MADRTGYDPSMVQRRMLVVRRQLENDLQELRLLDRELNRIESELMNLQRSLRGQRVEGAEPAHARFSPRLDDVEPGAWGPN